MTTLKYGAKGIPVNNESIPSSRFTKPTQPTGPAKKSDFIDVRLAARRRRRKQKQILLLSISLFLVLLTMLAIWLSG